MVCGVTCFHVYTHVDDLISKVGRVKVNYNREIGLF